MSTGRGHNQLEEKIVVGLPVMKKTSFVDTEGEWWKQILLLRLEEKKGI